MGKGTKQLTAVATTVLLVLALSSAAPAQVQSTFQFRYWGTPFIFTNGAATGQNSASAFGLTVRGDSTTRPWGVSFRFDQVNATPTFWPWNRATLWDANLHYRFGSNLSNYWGLLAGYQRVSVTDPGTFNTGSGGGVRIGTDFRWQTTPGMGWYATGEAAYGFSWGSSFPSFPGLTSGTATDYRVAVGYEFQGGIGLEAGYRQLRWNIPVSPGCGPCIFEFSGWTAALTVRK